MKVAGVNYTYGSMAIELIAEKLVEAALATLPRMTEEEIVAWLDGVPWDHNKFPNPSAAIARALISKFPHTLKESENGK